VAGGGVGKNISGAVGSAVALGSTEGVADGAGLGMRVGAGAAEGAGVALGAGLGVIVGSGVSVGRGVTLAGATVTGDGLTAGAAGGAPPNGAQPAAKRSSTRTAAGPRWCNPVMITQTYCHLHMRRGCAGGQAARAQNAFLAGLVGGYAADQARQKPAPAQTRYYSIGTRRWRSA